MTSLSSVMGIIWIILLKDLPFPMIFVSFLVIVLEWSYTVVETASFIDFPGLFSIFM